MRLTLRTLLAWLDGVVAADEAGPLGEKIAGSAAAKLIVERIRAVVAHAGIDAPRVDGRGLGGDANSVAEYLTNSMAADSVAAFERVCLESDAHLAEVAACHRMLVEARNDASLFTPPEPEVFDRLVQKIGGLPGSRVTRPIGPPPAGSRPAAVMASGQPQSHRAAGGWTAWASVITAVVLVALLAGFLIWKVMPFSMPPVAMRTGADSSVRPDRRGDVATGDSTAGVQAGHRPEDAAVAKPMSKEADVAAGVPGSEAADEASTVAKAPSEPTTAPSIAPASPSTASRAPEVDSPAVEETAQPASGKTAQPAPEKTAQPASEKPAAPTIENTSPPAFSSPPASRVPGGDALAIASASPAGQPLQPLALQEAGAATPPRDVQAAGPPGAAPIENAFAVVGPTPLLLHRIAESAEPTAWEMLPPGAPISRKEDLLVPGGFQPTLSVQAATIRLEGATRAVVTELQDGVVQLEVVFGRAVVSSLRPDQTLAVVAGGLVGRIVGGEGGPVGIEVRLEREPGTDPATASSAAASSNTASSNTASSNTVARLAFPQGGLWRAVAPSDPADPLADDRVAPGMVITALGSPGQGTVPSISSAAGRLPWLEEPSSSGLLDLSAANAMAAMSVTVQPVSSALDRLLEDKRLENRAAAAAALSLIGRYEPLVEVLSAEEPGRRLAGGAWSRLEQETVPLALARGPASAGRFLRALEDGSPVGSEALMKRLVIGFSDDDLANGGDAQLVEALAHPSLVVRRLAAARLFEVTRPKPFDRLRYRPDGLPDSREEALKWWRAQLEKGLIRRDGTGGLSKPGGE